MRLSLDRPSGNGSPSLYQLRHQYQSLRLLSLLCQMETMMPRFQVIMGIRWNCSHVAQCTTSSRFPINASLHPCPSSRGGLEIEGDVQRGQDMYGFLAWETGSPNSSSAKKPFEYKWEVWMTLHQPRPSESDSPGGRLGPRGCSVHRRLHGRENLESQNKRAPHHLRSLGHLRSWTTFQTSLFVSFAELLLPMDLIGGWNTGNRWSGTLWIESEGGWGFSLGCTHRGKQNSAPALKCPHPRSQNLGSGCHMRQKGIANAIKLRMGRPFWVIRVGPM